VTETPETDLPVTEDAIVEPAATETPETAVETDDTVVDTDEAGGEPEMAEPAVEEPEPESETTEPESETTEPEPAVAEPEPEPEPEPETSEPAADIPDAGRPHPTPSLIGPRPTPRPRATPGAGAGKTSPSHKMKAPVDPAAAASARAWGRIDDDGTVWVREAAGERVVGQYADAEADQAVELYVLRFLDLQARVALFEARLSATDLPVKEIDATLAKLHEEVAEPAAVGDLDGLRAYVAALDLVAQERRAQADAARLAAREAALAARTVIVEEAEKIAGISPEKMQWRPTGERLRVLLDQWKELQRTGPRVDRAGEEDLWKRFSHARTTFDRERRHYFASLEQRNTDAKTVKEGLVGEAESLATSTEWGDTARAFRDLMTQWKTAGHASRKDDDELWARFRAAQDGFFARRTTASQQTDDEFKANLEVKLGLLARAEALLPVTNLSAARATLRDVQEKWEQAGKVPRADVQRVEGRLRDVEKAIRDAEQVSWQRSNPETKARAESALAQLQSAIESLEADLDKAKGAGDARAVEQAEAALAARRAWFEQIERAAEGE